MGFPARQRPVTERRRDPCATRARRVDGNEILPRGPRTRRRQRAAAGLWRIAGALTLGLAVTIVATSVARAGVGAQEGLYLTWNDCAMSSASRHDLHGLCDVDDGQQVLFAAFTLAQAIDSVVALELVIDVQHSGAALPAWWQYQPKGCRQGSLVANSAFLLENSCADFWNETATVDGLAGYLVGEPHGGAAQARMKIAFSLLPQNFRRLEAGPMYYAAKLLFRNSRTSLCDGCLEPACLVLNSILVGRLPGASGGDVLLQASGPNQAQRATWQGTGADCDAVPVLPRTWGAIKSLYR